MFDVRIGPGIRKNVRLTIYLSNSLKATHMINLCILYLWLKLIAQSKYRVPQDICQTIFETCVNSTARQALQEAVFRIRFILIWIRILSEKRILLQIRPKIEKISIFV